MTLSAVAMAVHLAGCGDGNNDNIFLGGGCGDGVVDADEQCDGSNLDGATCVSRGFASGTLSCTASCHFDTSQCTGTGPTATSGATPEVTPTVEVTPGPTSSGGGPTQTPELGGATPTPTSTPPP